MKHNVDILKYKIINKINILGIQMNHDYIHGGSICFDFYIL
jgi:hypothetical protein